MKKIPTILPKSADLSSVIEGDLMLNIHYFKIKIDGTACMIKNGKPYCRFDAKLFKRKKGKIITFTKEEVISKLPSGAIPCQEPDEKSGHFPHWIPVLENDPSQKYIYEGFLNILEENIIDGTYECIGPKLQGNPHGEEQHEWIPHTHKNLTVILNLENRNPFNFFKEYFKLFQFEGLVAYNDKDEPIGKIRRSDYKYENVGYSKATDLIK
jgi:hypothetical protein